LHATEAASNQWESNALEPPRGCLLQCGTTPARLPFTRPHHGMRSHPGAFFLLQLCTLLAAVQEQ
jgi:hypothetical protein